MKKNIFQTLFLLVLFFSPLQTVVVQCGISNTLETLCSDNDRVCTFFCNKYFVNSNCTENKYLYLNLNNLNSTSYNSLCQIVPVVTENTKLVMGDDYPNLINKIDTVSFSNAIAGIKFICDREVDSITAFKRAQLVYNETFGEFFSRLGFDSVKLARLQDKIINSVIIKNYKSLNSNFCSCEPFTKERVIETRYQFIGTIQRECKRVYSTCDFSTPKCAHFIYASFYDSDEKTVRIDFSDGKFYKVMITSGSSSWELKNTTDTHYEVDIPLSYGTQISLEVKRNFEHFKVEGFNYLQHSAVRLCYKETINTKTYHTYFNPVYSNSSAN